MEFPLEFLYDLSLPGGWPYKGPLMHFLEFLCQELLRADREVLEAQIRWMRQYQHSGFFLAQQDPTEAVLHPTRE